MQNITTRAQTTALKAIIDLNPHLSDASPTIRKIYYQPIVFTQWTVNDYSVLHHLRINSLCLAQWGKVYSAVLKRGGGYPLFWIRFITDLWNCRGTTLHMSYIVYLFKWMVIVCVHELSYCVCVLGKSCLVTMATNREDLVWAATLCCPCYDSADVVGETMNSHGERREQTGVQERQPELHVSERRTHPSPYGGIKQAWRAVIYWVCGGAWQTRLSLDRQSFN